MLHDARIRRGPIPLALRTHRRLLEQAMGFWGIVLTFVYAGIAYETGGHVNGLLMDRVPHNLRVAVQAVCGMSWPVFWFTFGLMVLADVVIAGYSARGKKCDS